ncbi:MAG TPA: fumarylacetoacetate hydrolase family protein, partial [Azospira sp.]|nr:fumarylacetoacetate hydrolase family protein [Azospira sp.]
MKLASLKQGGRDGTLVVVSRDLTQCQPVPGIARTLQAALDDWEVIAPQLAEVYAALNNGAARHAAAFDPAACHSPLPRAYQWADGSAYVNHVELVRKARGAGMPPEFWNDPLMYQGGSDSFVGPRDAILARDEAWGIDFEAEVAVVTGDVTMAATPADCRRQIRLLMLVNDVSLRNLIPAELAKGFG